MKRILTVRRISLPAYQGKATSRSCQRSWPLLRYHRSREGFVTADMMPWNSWYCRQKEGMHVGTKRPIICWPAVFKPWMSQTQYETFETPNKNRRMMKSSCVADLIMPSVVTATNFLRLILWTKYKTCISTDCRRPINPGPAVLQYPWKMTIHASGAASQVILWCDKGMWKTHLINNFTKNSTITTD